MQHAGQSAEPEREKDAEKEEEEHLRHPAGQPEEEDGEDRRREQRSELELSNCGGFAAHRPFSSPGRSISAATVSSSRWPAPSALFCGDPAGSIPIFCFRASRWLSK